MIDMLIWNGKILINYWLNKDGLVLKLVLLMQLALAWLVVLIILIPKQDKIKNI
jgi:hypothetical protein